MRVSIVIPVLNSHEIVRRQLLHYQKMDFAFFDSCGGVEIIFVDDGSNPPLKDMKLPEVKNFKIIETKDSRPWTWALARNAGAKEAKGTFLLMADIDYIIPEQAINAAIELAEDRMNFQREFGVLDENGKFTQDINTLRMYGLLESRIATKGVAIPAHTNEFVIRRTKFFELGGYREDLIGRKYPQGEDRKFQGTWDRAMAAGKVARTYDRPKIYMFPNGKFCGDVDYNHSGLFHTLSRKVLKPK